MNKFFKKAVVGTLAAAMVMGSGVTALADSVTSLDGTGHNEGKLPDYPAVTSITLPTVEAASPMFNFIIDPNDLISQITAGANAHYGTKTFNTGDTLFFLNTEGNKQNDKDYSAKSDKLSATNNSARDVDLTITASAALGDNEEGKDVGFATSKAGFASNADADTKSTKKELFIAVEGSTKGYADDATDTAATPVAIKGIGSSNAAKLTMTLPGNKGNYDLTQNQGTYAYTQKTGDSLKWSSAKFNLDGACNTNATWGNETLPKLNVTWSWAEHLDSAAPSATATQAVLESGKTAAISVDLGLGDLAATGIASFTNVGLGNDWIAAGAAEFDSTNGIITITSTSSVTDILNSEDITWRQFKIKFNDSANTEVTVTLTAKN